MRGELAGRETLGVGGVSSVRSAHTGKEACPVGGVDSLKGQGQSSLEMGHIPYTSSCEVDKMRVEERSYEQVFTGRSITGERWTWRSSEWAVEPSGA